MKLHLMFQTFPQISGLGGSLEPAGSYEGVLSEEFGSVRASQKSPPVFRMKIMAQVNQVLEQRLDHTQDG